MNARNPWITTEETEEQTAAPDPVDTSAPHAAAAVRPQGGVPEVDAADRLPRRSVGGPGPWVLGVHGGSGETTLATWLDLGATGHSWPVNPDQRPVVVLAARTDARGLAAARRAATEWASGSVPVTVAGLVLMGDAPGRLPGALRDQVRQLSGAVPATWAIPFLPGLRTVESAQASPPAGVNRTLRSIQHHITQEET